MEGYDKSTMPVNAEKIFYGPPWDSNSRPRQHRLQPLYPSPLPTADFGRTIFYGVVSIAQLVEVTDSSVLGGVAEIVGSNPRVCHKIFFSIYRHS